MINWMHWRTEHGVKAQAIVSITNVKFHQKTLDQNRQYTKNKVNNIWNNNVHKLNNLKQPSIFEKDICCFPKIYFKFDQRRIKCRQRPRLGPHRRPSGGHIL